MAPQISVLFPALDHNDHFEVALQSLLNQTFRDFEIFILHPYSKKFDFKNRIFSDSRILFYSCPDVWNLSETLNFGIKISRAQFIARMDSDDISEISRFESQITYLKENSHVTSCGSWATLFGTESYIFQPSERWDMLRVDSLFGCQFIHPSMMFSRKTVLERNLFYDESLNATEDFELWSRWVELSPMGNIPKSLINYRRHADSSTNRNKEAGEIIYLQTMGHLWRRGGFDAKQTQVEICNLAFNGKEISTGQFEILNEMFESILAWNTKSNFYNEHYLISTVRQKLSQVKNHWKL